MCDSVRYYDRWVNGEGLRLAQLAGQYPHGLPEPCAGAPEHTALPLTLQFAPAGQCAAHLPALDPDALAPITHVLLHGSMATQDACAFSDVDIAVFVDDENQYTRQQHARAVLELRRLLHSALAFDPLMHHGLMFAPASMRHRYDQRFLPVETLAQARLLHGPDTMDLHLERPPASLFAASLRQSAQSIAQHVERADYLGDDYLLKNFLSGVLLLPARVLAARGTFVYKRDSFALARPLFRTAEWEFIARCEALRALWQRPSAPLPHRMLPARVHPHLRRVIGRHMAPRLNVRRLSAAMVSGLRASAHRFLANSEFAA